MNNGKTAQPVAYGHLGSISGVDPDDDSLLVERAKQDPQAFGVLYERHVGRIYTYIYYRTGNQQDAEDPIFSFSTSTTLVTSATTVSLTVTTTVCTAGACGAAGAGQAASTRPATRRTANRTAHFLENICFSSNAKFLRFANECG